MFFSKWFKPKETPESEEFKSNIIYGYLLETKWHVDHHELSYIILKQNLSVLELPKRFHRYSKYDLNLYKIDSIKLLEFIREGDLGLKDKAFWLPEIKKITPYVNSAFKYDPIPTPANIRFSKPSLEDFQKLKEKRGYEHPEETRKETTNKIIDIIEEHESDIKKNPNVFSLIGKVWFVKFKNQEWGLYPDLEKYKYIVHLLELTRSSSENHEYFIYNSDLISKIKGVSDLSENREAVLKEDLNESDLGKELSSEDFRKFKDIGYDLLEELNLAKQADDPIKQKEAEKKFKKYQSYILNDYGIKSQISKDGGKIYFGTYYRPSKEGEKLRQLIKNQTNNAIKDFKEGMPTLSKHLQSCVKTKLNKTVYTPEQIHWQVSF